jgi:hypothetical protein
VRLAPHGYYSDVLRRSRVTRLYWFFAALLQLTLPAFASVADARAEAESRGARVHIEATGTTSCPRIHPEDCVVCRVLASGATTTAVASLQVPIARTIDEGPAHTEATWCVARLAGDPSERAPPL